MQCFNQSVPAADYSAGRAAFACVVDDVRTGGTVQGNRYIQISAGEREIGALQGLAVFGLLIGSVLQGMALIL